jgi:hypothetical protein
MINSISDNSGIFFDRVRPPQATADTASRTDGSSVRAPGHGLGEDVWVHGQGEWEGEDVSSYSRTETLLDGFRGASGSAGADPSLCIAPLLGKRTEFWRDLDGQGVSRKNGYRVYSITDSSGRRQYYFQPDDSGISVSLGSSGGRGSLDVLSLSMRIKAAEARYRENYRPPVTPGGTEQNAGIFAAPEPVYI